jgi:hypothetical protein
MNDIALKLTDMEQKYRTQLDQQLQANRNAWRG